MREISFIYTDHWTETTFLQEEKKSKIVFIWNDFIAFVNS